MTGFWEKQVDLILKKKFIEVDANLEGLKQFFFLVFGDFYEFAIFSIYQILFLVDKLLYLFLLLKSPWIFCLFVTKD